MPKPKKVWIGAFAYDIVWDDKLASIANAAGATNELIATLIVDPSLDRQVLRETLIHEILHAAWKQTPLRTMFPDEDPDSPGELIIQALSPILYAVVRENEEMLEWFRK